MESIADKLRLQLRLPADSAKPSEQVPHQLKASKLILETHLIHSSFMPQILIKVQPLLSLFG